MPYKDPVARKKYREEYYKKYKDTKYKEYKVEYSKLSKEKKEQLREAARARYKKKKGEGFNKYAHFLSKLTDEEYQKYRERRRKASSRYYEKNKEIIKIKNAQNPGQKTLSRHGLNESEYWDIYSKQLGVCAICTKADTSKIKKTFPLLIDHCHNNLNVRGLLCTQCNIILGMARDKVDVLENAVKYLKQHGH